MDLTLGLVKLHPGELVMAYTPEKILSLLPLLEDQIANESRDYVCFMNQSVHANQVEWQVMLEHYQKKSATEAYFSKLTTSINYR